MSRCICQFDRYIDGPKQWSRKWRRIWLATLPVSWVIWPAGMLAMAIVFAIFYPFYVFTIWFRDLWNRT